jgi:hypothetical protein
MSQNYKASAVLTKGATEATGALNRNTALAKAGLSNQVNADFAGLRDLEAKNRAQTAEQNAAAAKQEQEDLKTGKNVDINNQVALRQAQTATTIAMDNLVQKGVGPVTAGMLKLATGIEKVVTGIPGTGTKTSTSARPGEQGSGRGTETPAVAGYGTTFKPEDLAKFLEEAVTKGYQAITGPATPVAPPVTTGRQAQEVLTRASGPSPTGPRATMSNEQANNILQRAAGPNTNYRTNLGDTTPTTEPSAIPTTSPTTHLRLPKLVWGPCPPGQQSTYVKDCAFLSLFMNRNNRSMGNVTAFVRRSYYGSDPTSNALFVSFSDFYLFILFIELYLNII